MKHTGVAIAWAALTLASGACMAQGANFTMEVGGGPVSVAGYRFEGIVGHGTWAFSEHFTGAMDIAQAQTLPVAPGELTTDPATEIISVYMPLRALGATLDGSTSVLTINKPQFAGGVQLKTSPLLVNGKKNGASTGGSLTLTDFTVDLGTRSIFATLTGANNVGTKTNQLIWNYSSIEGETAARVGQCGWLSACLDFPGAQVSGLAITQDAFDLFAKSLGLTTVLGIPALQGVTDYGTFAISYSVPEPSSAVLMLVGVLALGIAARRTRPD